MGAYGKANFGWSAGRGNQPTNNPRSKITARRAAAMILNCPGNLRYVSSREVVNLEKYRLWADLFELLMLLFIYSAGGSKGSM